MSVPDSRKTFLAKVAICVLAAATVPRMFARLAGATSAPTGGAAGAGTAPGATAIRLQPDPHSVAREAVS